MAAFQWFTGVCIVREYLIIPHHCSHNNYVFQLTYQKLPTTPLCNPSILLGSLAM
jgi:hypothetical protein